VRALHRSLFPKNLSEQELSAIEWVKGDIMDVDLLSEVMEGIEQLYHAAALVSFNPARKYELFRTNIDGTANIVNAALEFRVKKMVHVSSVSAMGRIRTGVAVDETMFWTRETSNSNYGQSKYLAELEVWRGIGEGLNGVIVNPTLILGAGDWENGSSKMFKTAFDEFPWYTEGASGFVDVRDVVKAMTELMASEISGERFILNAENRKFKDVFTLMSNEFGKRPPHRKVNRLLAGLVWRVEWLKSRMNKKEPLLTKETSKTGQASVEFNNSKLKKFLPSFQYIPVDQTIRDVCKEILGNNK
jgi:nucleoside-diphosphate-sugar epimerase